MPPEIDTDQDTRITGGGSLTIQAAALPAMPEDEVLDYTQRVRRTVVNKLTANGIPGDNGDRALLVQALDGLDRQAMGVKRIKADEKASSGLSEASALVAQLLKEAGRTASRVVIDGAVREVPTLGDEVPRPTLVPGELDISPRQMTYDEFAESRPKFVPEPSEED